MSTLYETMQTLCCFLSCCNSIYCKLGTGENIATNENIRFGSLVRQLICHRINAAEELHVCIF